MRAAAFIGWVQTDPHKGGRTVTKAIGDEDPLVQRAAITAAFAEAEISQRFAAGDDHHRQHAEQDAGRDAIQLAEAMLQLMGFAAFLLPFSIIYLATQPFKIEEERRFFIKTAGIAAAGSRFGGSVSFTSRNTVRIPAGIRKAANQ